MAFTFLDPWVRKFRKLEENESTNVIKNAKKNIKTLINDYEIDPVATTPTPGS